MPRAAGPGPARIPARTPSLRTVVLAPPQPVVARDALPGARHGRLEPWVAREQQHATCAYRASPAGDARGRNRRVVVSGPDPVRRGGLHHELWRRRRRRYRSVQGDTIELDGAGLHGRQQQPRLRRERQLLRDRGSAAAGVDRVERRSGDRRSDLVAEERRRADDHPRDGRCHRDRRRQEVLRQQLRRPAVPRLPHGLERGGLRSARRARLHGRLPVLHAHEEHPELRRLALPPARQPGHRPRATRRAERPGREDARKRA